MSTTSYYCQILVKLEFSQQIQVKHTISNFMKIRPLEAEFYRADRKETDRQA